MASLLDRLAALSVIVADTGDIASIERLRPRDATTNPSLILKAASRPEYAPLVRAALAQAPAGSRATAVERVLVAFGTRILQAIEGRVSTEVDARLSFDTRATVERGRTIIDLYERAGIGRARVLVKIAGTWEGIRAVEVLEREGIHCNITLLFAPVQALASAAAGATLISPFVGRVYDWHRKAAGDAWDEAARAGAGDPGVQLVRAIHAQLKGAGYATEVMGASFRNIGQIMALAGCDLLTISPELLDQLAAADLPLARALDAAGAAPVEPLVPAEPAFRYTLATDAMANDKLAEGIRLFAADTVKLEAVVAALG